MHILGELLAPQYLHWLWDGFLLTLWLSLWVSAISLAGGFLLCMARMEGRGALLWFSRAYLSFFRNTPLLVQLFFWYFGAAALIPEPLMQWLNMPHSRQIMGVEVEWPSFEFIAALWGLTLYTIAFMAEEFRAGVRGVPEGQFRAAEALGFGRWQTWRQVVLPQALRNAFSPIVGQVMNTVKNTSLTMSIGLAELSYASRQVETETFKAFQAFGMATLLYVLLIVLIELLSQGIQHTRRWRRLGA